MILTTLKRLFPGENGTAAPRAPCDVPTGLLQVTADATRCVQCGICVHNCPAGVEVREYARRGENVTDPRCIACGQCVALCPRGTLRWGPAKLVRDDNTLALAPGDLPRALRLRPRDAG